MVAIKVERFIIAIVAMAVSGAILPIIIPGDPTYNYVDGSPVYEAALAACYGLAGCVALVNFRQVLDMARRSPAFLILLMLTCASIYWGETPGIALRRVLAVLGATLLGIILAARLTVSQRLDALSTLFRISAILSLVVAVFLPQYGVAKDYVHLGKWIGVYSAKNVLGSAMGLAFIVDWYRPTRIITKLFWFCLYTLLLIKSDSMSPAAAVLLTLSILKAFEVLHQKYRVRPLTVALFLIVGGISFVVVISATGLLEAVTGRTIDLTGRTELWRELPSIILMHPWLGYGYGDFWGGASKESYEVTRKLDWIPMYAHNGYLEITISLGFLGLFLSSVFLASGVRQAVRRNEARHSMQDVWPLAFLIYFLIHNISECTILYRNSIEWAICVATVLDVLPERSHGALEKSVATEVDAVPVAAEEYA